MNKLRVIYLFCLLAIGFSKINAQMVGIASYYSNRLHGHKTSDGSRYHKDSMTCAHLTYPLGSLLQVKNIRNGKTVVVKVTDRGPFSKRRVIDLSYAAAKELDIIQFGITQVEVTPYNKIVIPFRDNSTVNVPELDWGDEDCSVVLDFASSLKEKRRQKSPAQHISKADKTHNKVVVHEKNTANSHVASDKAQPATAHSVKRRR